MLAAMDAWYCFGLTRPGPPIPGAERLPAAGIDALVTRVATEEWTGDNGARHLADVAWVAPRAAAHEQVLLAALAVGPVVPVRLGALFADPAALVARIAGNRAVIEGFLARGRAARQWQLTLAIDRPAAIAAIIAADGPWQAQQATRTPGVAYLAARSRERAAEGEVHRLADPAWAALIAGAQARDWTVAPLPRRDAELRLAVLAAEPPDTGWMGEEPALRGWSAQCAGPLPPWSFAPALDPVAAEAR